MPSGNERGANELWIPGGLLPSGYYEAVINGVPKDHLIIRDINVKWIYKNKSVESSSLLKQKLYFPLKWGLAALGWMQGNSMAWTSRRWISSTRRWRTATECCMIGLWVWIFGFRIALRKSTRSTSQNRSTSECCSWYQAFLMSL